MLNGPEWQYQYPGFSGQCLLLLNRAQECLNHLESFINDQDAIDCLLSTLPELVVLTEQAQVHRMADFARRLFVVLEVSCPATTLQGETLRTLQSCFALLAWQLELIDPCTGLLLLDEDEQQQLLERLTLLCGPGRCGAGTIDWPDLSY